MAEGIRYRTVKTANARRAAASSAAFSRQFCRSRIGHCPTAICTLDGCHPHVMERSGCQPFHHVRTSFSERSMREGAGHLTRPCVSLLTPGAQALRVACTTRMQRISKQTVPGCSRLSANSSPRQHPTSHRSRGYAERPQRKGGKRRAVLRVFSMTGSPPAGAIGRVWPETDVCMRHFARPASGIARAGTARFGIAPRKSPQTQKPPA